MLVAVLRVVFFASVFFSPFSSADATAAEYLESAINGIELVPVPSILEEIVLKQ